MADISKINLSGAVYNIKDATARANLNEIQNISDAEIDEITDFVLESLPSSYVYGYETAAIMQADLDLQKGMIVHTNGFTTSGDGNAAYYTISNSGTADGSAILALQNGLRAIKISESSSITTAKIVDSAVTTLKIADNAVTAAKIASAAADGLRTMNTTQPGVAKVGAGLAMNNGALELNGGSIAPAVTAWLNAHPEATTTVQDNSINDDKLVQHGGVLDTISDLKNRISLVDDLGNNWSSYFRGVDIVKTNNDVFSIHGTHSGAYAYRIITNDVADSSPASRVSDLDPTNFTLQLVAGKKYSMVIDMIDGEPITDTWPLFSLCKTDGTNVVEIGAIRLSDFSQEKMENTISFYATDEMYAVAVYQTSATYDAKFSIYFIEENVTHKYAEALKDSLALVSNFGDGFWFNGQGLTINKRENTYIFSGTSSGAHTYKTITGDTIGSASTMENVDPSLFTIRLNSGLPYKMVVKQVSGTPINDVNPWFSLCKTDGTNVMEVGKITFADFYPDKTYADIPFIATDEYYAVIFHQVSATYDVTYSINFILTSESEVKNTTTYNKDAIDKIHASRFLRDSSAVPLTLLWFSDIHRWVEPLARLIEFTDYMSEYIDDSIVTGDITRADSSTSQIAAFNAFWYGTSGTNNILMAMGNHEYYEHQTGENYGKISLSDIDNYYFQNFDNWGAVRESNYPFYYKDYPTQKIRLIVADPAVTNEEADETSWLETTLEGARSLGYSVVVAAHYIRLEDDTETNMAVIYDNDWTNNVHRSFDPLEEQMGYDWHGCDIVKCVSDFIENGGSFLCYMIGHRHRDILSYPKGHPEQLIITLASASSQQTTKTENDLPRVVGTKSDDCFNVITFDATNKVIKCVRIGSDMNMHMHPRSAFSYDVTAHEFLGMV